MDIKSVGAYSAAFLIGASGIPTIAGLSYALISGIKAIAYKILAIINSSNSKRYEYNDKFNNVKGDVGLGLVIAIPIVGAIIVAYYMLNGDDKKTDEDKVVVNT